MKMEFTECMGVGTGLFEDFVKYKTVDKYVAAVVSYLLDSTNQPRPNFLPLHLYINRGIGNKFECIVDNGRMTENTDKVFKWLKRQNGYIRNLMSDSIVVKGDGFERIMFISWE